MRKLSKTSHGSKGIQLPQEWHKQTGIKNSRSGCVTSSLYMLTLPVGIFYPVTFTSVFRNDVFLCIVTLRVGIGLLFYSQTQGLSHCNFPASQFIFPASRSPSFNHVITFFIFYDLRSQILEFVKTRMKSTWIVKIKILNSFSYKIWKLDRK